MAKVVDALFLYNELESSFVEKIVQKFDEAGYITFFWKRNVEYGQEIESGEMEHLKLAKFVIVCLGKAGWGKNHLRLVNEAIALKKKLIPVKIGNYEADIDLQADGLFKNRRYIDLSNLEQANFHSLFAQLGGPGKPVNIPDNSYLVEVLIDGNEYDRKQALNRIQALSLEEKHVLGTVIQNELTQNFQVGDSIFTARRPPDRLPSIRSWLLAGLVFSELETSETRDILLEHLDVNVEPVDFVRYWTFGQLHRHRPTFYQDVITMALSSGDEILELMAKAAMSSQFPDIVRSLKNMLGSSSEEQKWKAFRVLRIVAVPEVAAEVFHNLLEWPTGDPLAHDIIYVVANLGMLDVIVELIEKSNFTKFVAERILQIAVRSDKNTIMPVATILTRLQPENPAALLDGIQTSVENAHLIKQIREEINRLSQNGNWYGSKISSYDSDTIDVSKPFIDIRGDVMTLTALIMSKKMSPPLAIGLFGKWGTGKSFFMQSIKQAVTRLRDNNANKPDSQFMSHVVQIEFNAWHYADTNLWASLVDYLFERLKQHVAPQETYEEKQARLIQELSEKEQVAEVAKTTYELNAQQLSEMTSALEQVKKARQERTVQFRELTAADLEDILMPNQRADIDKTLGDLGLPKLTENIADFDKAVSDAWTLRGRLFTLLTSIAFSANWLLIIVLMIFVLIAAPLGLWAIRHYMGTVMASVAGVIAEFSALISAAVIIIRRGLKKAKAGMQVLEDARERIVQKLEAKKNEKSEEEATLEDVVGKLKSQIADNKAELEKMQKDIHSAKTAILKFNEEQGLAKFLTDKTASDVYAKHLGLISTIRKDFSLLVEKINQQTTDNSIGRRKLERIILYIDDLDRCPYQKVTEVLQAVHLLLAYPLFVVVVGVDAMWLRQSINFTYDIGGHGQPVRADKFLEKIFQVPFHLNPMTKAGFGNLMHGLLLPVEKEISQMVPVHAVQKESVAPDVVPEETADSRTDNRAEVGTSQKNVTQKSVADVVQRPVPSDYQIIEEAMEIKTWEADFAAELFPFIDTPRSAKRFTNIYRIIKAALQPSEIAAFEGSAELPGQFYAPMLLLAITINQPDIAVMLFPAMIEQKQPISIISLAESLKSKAPPTDLAKWNQFIGSFQRLSQVNNLQLSTGSYKQWIPKVARFSFELSETLFNVEV